MAFDYSSLASIANTLISDFGRSMTLRRRSHTVPDTDKPWEITESNTDYSITAVMDDYSAREVDGATIQEGDRRVMFAASGLSITPEAGDQIIDDSIAYTIVHVEQLKPGDTALIYIVQARRLILGRRS